MKFLTKILSEETLNELKEKLGEDLVKQVDAKIGDYSIDVAKEKLIPKAVYDADKEKLKQHNTELSDQLKARDQQLTELGEKAKGNTELELQIKNLQEANVKSTEQYQAKIKELSQSYGLKEALGSFKPKNVISLEALIDKSKLEYDDNGKVVKGLNEQIDEIKKSDSYLFGETIPSGTGHPQTGGIDIGSGDAGEADKISQIFQS